MLHDLDGILFIVFMQVTHGRIEALLLLGTFDPALVDPLLRRLPVLLLRDFPRLLGLVTLELNQLLVLVVKVFDQMLVSFDGYLEVNILIS